MRDTTGVFSEAFKGTTIMNEVAKCTSAVYIEV
jgi:hypothetical protein